MSLVTIYFSLVGFTLLAAVVCISQPPDPRDLFPNKGPVDGLIRTLHSREYTSFANRTVQWSLIPPFTTRSITECSISCLQYFCLAYFYHFDRLDCTLIHDRYYNNSVTIEDTGSRYYLTFYDKCPSEHGYVYYQTQNLCLKLNTTKVVYSKAFYYCALERATFVRIDSVKKLNIVQNLLGGNNYGNGRLIYTKDDIRILRKRELDNGIDQAFWVEAKDTQGFNGPNDFAYIMAERIQFTNNRFEFVDKTEMPVYDWMTGKPDTEDVRIVMGGNNQQYDDVSGEDLHAFICEKHIRQS